MDSYGDGSGLLVYLEVKQDTGTPYLFTFGRNCILVTVLKTRNADPGNFFSLIDSSP